MVLTVLAASAALEHCARLPTIAATDPVEPPVCALDGGSLAVLCGGVIDGVSWTVARRTMVVIRRGRIVQVVRDATLLDAAATQSPVLDLSLYTCLPGLIDMHTHLTDRPADTADLRVYFARSTEDTLQLSQENARATLLAGFTTVRNMGTYVLGADTTLRDSINRGATAGPRMQTSGPYLTVPHGGGDLFVPGVEEPADNARFHAGVAQGAQAFRERAKHVLDGGADLLKAIGSGAVLAFGGVPGAPEMTEEEMRAVVEVARAANRRVAVHAHGAESILMAIRAGADTIEHASYLDMTGITLALERGNVALVMDVYNGDYVDTEGRRQNWPDEFLRKNRETTELQRRGFARAVLAGVPIAYGTDAGVYPHGLNARQFRVMVAHGMAPWQAIQSATTVAARYLGWSDRVGSLEPGKLGDLIAVAGDPLADVSQLEHVAAVIKGGVASKCPVPSECPCTR